MKRLMIITGIFLLLGLAACGGGVAAETAVSSNNDSSSDATVLSADYDGALTIEGQLALGTLSLEDGDQALNTTQAEELLPLWQAFQSLTNSGSAADAELQAVIKQIESGMNPAQISTIADMQLTEESLAKMVEEGQISFGRGNFGGGTDGAAPTGRELGGGGLPGGGGRGGGLPGGGPGAGNIDPDQLATRQAEREAGGGDFQNRILTNAVIRLLETKTGVEPSTRPGGDFDFAIVLETISETTGLTVEELQAATAAGSTLSEIINENGGNVTAVHDILVTALADSPIAENQDLDEWVTNLLEGRFGQRPLNE